MSKQCPALEMNNFPLLVLFSILILAKGRTVTKTTSRKNTSSYLATKTTAASASSKTIKPTSVSTSTRKTLSQSTIENSSSTRPTAIVLKETETINLAQPLVDLLTAEFEPRETATQLNEVYTISMDDELASLSPVVMKSVEITPESILEGKLLNTDRRYGTFKLAMDLMRSKKHRVMIETGTARRGDKNCVGDGCSTVIFAQWAERIGMQLNSVDTSKDSIMEAINVVRFYNGTGVHQADSVQYLREHKGPIDFLYLDTMDHDGSNPRPAQEQALKEIIAAYGKLHEDSVVMMDDCGLSGGGKCVLVELFLREFGWRVLVKGYQLIMVTSKKVAL